MKLCESLDQLTLAQTVLQCILSLKNEINKKEEANFRFLGRAMLLIAHGLAILPSEGLEVMELNVHISFEQEVCNTF